MQKALVLAGGGVTGIAWETGVLLGFRDEGVDVAAHADLVVGTSAGSTVAAQILSDTDLAELDAAQRSRRPTSRSPPSSTSTCWRRSSPSSPVAGCPTRRRGPRIGALALAADTVDEATRRAVIEARLPSHDWPDRRLLVTAVDALTGELAVFDVASGATLVDAVAASCAVPGVWPPVSIGGRRYVDGGVRSTANADLAAGHDVVVVLAPLSGPAAGTLDPEVAALRSGGAAVVVVAADPEAAEAMGINPLDPAFRRPAAEHGRRQGRAAAPAVASSWSNDAAR